MSFDSNDENDYIAIHGDGTGQHQDGARTPFLDSPALFFQERFQAGSIKGSVFTLVVAIVGAGTLSVPYAIEQSGFLVGSLLFIAGAYLSYLSLRIVVLCSALTGVKSYPLIGKHLYGERMGYLSQAMLMLNLYGTTISYIVASGNLITPVLRIAFGYSSDALHFPNYLQPKFVMICAVCGVVLPLALQRTMGALRYSSLVGVFCSCYLCFVVFIKYFQYCNDEEIVNVVLPSNKTISQQVQCFWKHSNDLQEPISLAPHQPVMNHLLKTIPIVVYAYTCHPNVLPVFMELQKPSRKRMSKVLGRAVMTAMFMYLVLGNFGYFTFKSQLECSDGSFLKNDYHDDGIVLLGSVGMGIAVVTAIPLFVHAFRSTIFSAILDDESDANNAPAFLHYGLTITMLAAALLPAILVKDISVVFTILGSTTNPMICFVLPTLFLFRAAPGDMYMSEKAISSVVTVVICIISVISLGNTFFVHHEFTCPNPVPH